MVKIKIENFGPIIKGCISDDGWFEINKNTFLIGNQGSGKSTVAKLVSTLIWLEKSITRGDFDINKITSHAFINLFEFSRIKNYFKNSTYIEYIGERFQISFNGKGKKKLCM